MHKNEVITGNTSGVKMGLFIIFEGMEWVPTINLFRCAGISISRIFPCWNQCVTQSTPTRHPGSVVSFRDILVPKLLLVNGNIKKY